jgi:hypothetical protein
MARETKAERLVREAAERAAYEAEMAATYPTRLMNMLERAQKANFNLVVEDGVFKLVDRDFTRRSKVVELTLEYSKGNQEGLHELDWVIDEKEAARREAARKDAVKQLALSKLSVEERELLGL